MIVKDHKEKKCFKAPRFAMSWRNAFTLHMNEGIP
jgi:hypothetical protein